MELEGLDAQVRAVEDADDLGQCGLAAGQLHGRARATVAPAIDKPINDFFYFRGGQAVSRQVDRPRVSQTLRALGEGLEILPVSRHGMNHLGLPAHGTKPRVHLVGPPVGGGGSHHLGEEF